jgi:hypothetical protein
MLTPGKGDGHLSVHGEPNVVEYAVEVFQEIHQFF